MTIKELRLSMNMSQSRFAAQIGVDRSDLGKMENGKKSVTARVADKIREVFGTEVETGTIAPVETAAQQIPARQPEFFIQSPYGGIITPEKVLSKVPADVDAVYVRVDQNTIWWVRREENGATVIWE